MASRKRKYASIEEIEEAHQSPDDEESAGDRKRRKNRLNCALYRFRQRSAQVDGNERVGGNVQVRGSNGPPRSLIEQLLSSEVAPPAETAPVRVREASADHVVQQAIAGSEGLQRQRRECQAEQARRRRGAMSASQQERIRPVSSNYASVAEEDSDTSSEPRHMSLGPSVSSMLEIRAESQRQEARKRAQQQDLAPENRIQLR
ncbi:hypothetical protein PC117_g23615 [Phytophthora cactorum]|uniref:BZIP domain-containing protein n=1 Tax=Phytophthora cactorum TaxID=29920 RepID=A0A8T1B4I8_9STRA|nr:hypothetical protein PC117_g23615 [Phytophthora cactorum]KAG3009138.1 hypothetical protein PC120_g15802 [Phytophthora cactorum]